MTHVTSDTGYLHRDYAYSLAEFGTPRQLPRSGGWILIRAIPGTTDADAIGCYPLFACHEWSRLAEDVDDLRGELVALSLVADPFGSGDLTDLSRSFDNVVPFKSHYVADLRQPTSDFVSLHHRVRARRALRRMTIEVTETPLHWLDQWVELYATLVARHQLRGIRAFSRNAFARQLSVPGVVMFRASVNDQTVGFHLWYVQQGVAYSHLTAVNVLGRQLRASFAMYWSALELLSSRAAWADLGGSAGMAGGAGADGLGLFKRGWATGTRTAYFCSKVLDERRYGALLLARGNPEPGYFPGYRTDEFG